MIKDSRLLKSCKKSLDDRTIRSMKNKLEKLYPFLDLFSSKEIVDILTLKPVKANSKELDKILDDYEESINMMWMLHHVIYYKIEKHSVDINNPNELKAQETYAQKCKEMGRNPDNPFTQEEANQIIKHRIVLNAILGEKEALLDDLST